MKSCSSCKEIKPAKEFYSHRRNKDGLTYQCKVCMGRSSRRYRDDSPTYKAKDSKRSRLYALRNPESSRRAQATFREKHQEERREYSRKFSKENKSKKAAYLRKWRKLFPEKAAAQRYARRTRENGAPGISNEFQIAARIEMFGGRCWICRDKIQALDHVKPLARGGSNWPANLRPVCRTCNSSKGNCWSGVSDLGGLVEKVRSRSSRIAARRRTDDDTGGSD